jgi:alkylation response protein AidB-like acyl-CoA dehydrogenase
VINGSKTFITNGYSADIVVTAVRTSPERKAKGITLFAIPTDAEGHGRGRKLDKVGQHESDTAERFFEGVRVTDDDIVGELDNGFIHMMQNLPQERLGCAISNLAHVKQILGETIAYTIDRKAVGASIGSFQHNKFLLAGLVTQIEVTQAYVDQCVIAHTKKELTPVDAAKAKWWTSQVAERSARPLRPAARWLRLHERAPRRAWRDARVSKIWAGSNKIMKELIGRDLGL